jgi:hypothetical protein
MKKLLDEQIESFDATKENAEYEAFVWAFALHDDLLSKRALEWVRKHMFYWETALLSPNNFEIMKERLKLGPALAMLIDLASAVALDIPEFIQEMKEQAQKYGEDLARYHPQYEPSIQNGISKHTATVMMDELNEKIQLATIEIGRLSSDRAQAGIAMLDVQRLASLRVFFDDEAALSTGLHS